MKRKKDIESIIYEKLGVKQFRKLVFFLRDSICALLVFKSPKEIKKRLYNTASTYNIGQTKSIEDIKKYKKNIYINSTIHIVGLITCYPLVTGLIAGTISVSSIIWYLIAIIINSYCLMLQRYTYKRIKKAIEKATPRYERQKEQVRNKIREKDEKFEKHRYKIAEREYKKNRIPKETELTLEELMENASLEELERYRRTLIDMQMIMSLRENVKDDSSREDVELSIGKNKYLKLEHK